MKHFKNFIKRGLLASVGGPLIYAIVMLILGNCGVVQSLTVNEVVIGIFTSAILAFVASGVSVVHEIEKLNLFTATLIQVFVLYADYLVIYLLNGWLTFEFGILVTFTLIFFAGYMLVWLIVFLAIRANIKKLNQRLVK